MRPSRARYSGSAASCHMLSSVDCITTTSESEFLLLTAAGRKPSVLGKAAGGFCLSAAGPPR
jgi:hypothetical protein